MRFRQIDPCIHLFTLQALQLTTLPYDTPCVVKPDDLWWIGYDGPNAVAFCCIRPLGDGLWYLARAGVLSTHRGKGLQKRMIRLRVNAAMRNGAKHVITDCTLSNPASANSLIACGFKVYTPARAWGLPTSVYWRKELPC